MDGKFDLEGLGHHAEIADVVDAADGAVLPRVIVPTQHSVLHLVRNALRLHERLGLILGRGVEEQWDMVTRYEVASIDSAL